MEPRYQILRYRSRTVSVAAALIHRTCPARTTKEYSFRPYHPQHSCVFDSRELSHSRWYYAGWLLLERRLASCIKLSVVHNLGRMSTWISCTCHSLLLRAPLSTPSSNKRTTTPRDYSKTKKNMPIPHQTSTTTSPHSTTSPPMPPQHTQHSPRQHKTPISPQ